MILLVYVIHCLTPNLENMLWGQRLDFLFFCFLSSMNNNSMDMEDVSIVCKNQLINLGYALANVTQLIGTSSCALKSLGSGHIPRLCAQSTIRAHTGNNQLVFLSHIPPPLSPSLCFSLSIPLSLKTIKKHTSGYKN